MEDVKIKVIIKNTNTLLANANISINTTLYGFVTIKGFQIWKSRNFNSRLQESINIAPPSRFAYGHYVQIVFFEEMKSWYELEGLIYSTYLQEVSKKKVIETEEVNLDDIPL